MPDSYDIPLKYPASEDFLRDVLFEACGQAISYWCEIKDVVREGDTVCSFHITEHEGFGGEPREGRVDAGVLASGFAAALAPDFRVRPDIRSHLLAALVESDAGEIDIEAADVLIQAAMLGEIRYG